MSRDTLHVTVGGGGATSIWWLEARDPLNILQCVGQHPSPQQAIVQSQMSIVLMVRNPVLKIQL